MLRQGIVDLGSNTARLVVYAHEPGEWFRLVDDIREPVRLAEGLARDANLSPRAMERMRAALKLFADYVVATDLQRVDLIGTSALREAANSKKLLKAARELGFEVSILSGKEEAELGVLAVANGFAIDDAWVMDLGGGSLQLSRMEERAFKKGKAYPLGMVRMTEAHLRSDPPEAAEVEALEATLEEQLGKVAKTLEQLDGPLVAIGGTVRNLARVAQVKAQYPLRLLHGYLLRAEDLERITAELLSLPAARRAAMPGINPDRGDVIAAGAVTWRWLLRRSGREGLLISGHGLREGAFYRHFLPAPYRIMDLPRFAVRSLQARYPQPEVHVFHVRKLARRLFDGLQPLHGLGGRDRQLLDVAASLHDIGMAISYYRHHRHGADLLASGPLVGFDHREQALVMLLVRYHRKGTPRLGPFASLMGTGDEERLARLAACLRLAEYLERSHAGRVGDLQVSLDEARVEVRLIADEEPTVELWEGRKQAPLFEEAFCRRLELKV